MGMDVFGKNPKSETGSYFRANIWYWHPLWTYCEDMHPTLASKVQYPHTNDGDGLASLDSLKLGQAIISDLDSGKASDYILKRQSHIDSLPQESCIICHGLYSECNLCKGTGYVDNFMKSYSLDLSILREFSNFLIDSGGFEIW